MIYLFNFNYNSHLLKTISSYVIILFCILVVFTTCKKYDEGGLENLTRKHLFGGKKKGCTKTWKLKRFEVNGVDSTYLITGSGTIPDFYDKFITFKNEGNTNGRIHYSANTFLWAYSGTISPSDVKMSCIMFDENLTKDDSLQCKSIDGNYYCNRNLLYPEFVNGYSKLWIIKKLTKSELVIELSDKQTNFYKLILIQ
jgi:hypothetical protein